jgi:hypothetical protein
MLTAAYVLYSESLCRRTVLLLHIPTANNFFASLSKGAQRVIRFGS